MSTSFKTIESPNKVLHVDLTGFTKATVAEQVSFVALKTKEGFTIDICEFPRLAFNNLTQILEAYKSNPSLTLVSLNNTIETSDATEKEILENFKAALVVFTEAYDDLIELSKSKYPFETIPTGYNLDKNFKFLTSRVRRANDVDHFLTNLNIQSIMNECLDIWSVNGTNTKSFNRTSLQAHSMYRDVTIDHNSVRIGCQTIRRFEFEQIAVRLGFKGDKFVNVPKLK